ncbi:MAG: SpoIIE family protein phosphatase [Bacteroidetes bacterium]|nr:SpoIIE family protein phosphatase [Bacteroidota bacterium]
MKAKLIVLICVMSFSLSLQADEHFKKHIGFSETFFGSEEDYQVCYPKDHKNFFYSIIGFALLSTTLGFFIIRIKTKSNKLLKEKNAIIEEKNHDMVSSITYARRIQNSILPSKNLLNELSNNLFVFYKPKDIVSGDFYWAHKDGENLYMAVVDCTGHGVPGAFLSLVGKYSLDKAVKEDHRTNPSEILDKMNEYVKGALQQEENKELRDGMEVAFCKLNTKTGELEYAGANLSLLVISKGEIEEVKSSKCTVGSVQEHVIEAPKTHKIQLEKGDSFYVFSDGFADQMGGKLNKKYKSVNLKSFIKATAKETPQSHCMLLSKELEQWRGNYEQVDDVCVMGYKL